MEQSGTISKILACSLNLYKKDEDRGKREQKKPYISLSQLGGVWMVGVKGYIGLNNQACG
jgi:hypothetical protein